MEVQLRFYIIAFAEKVITRNTDLPVLIGYFLSPVRGQTSAQNLSSLKLVGSNFQPI